MGRRKNSLEAVSGSAKLMNLHKGIGSSLLILEQTALNLPADEVDKLVSYYRELLDDLFKLTKLRLKDLLGREAARSKVSLHELSSSMVAFQQIVQALAGYTTKSAQIDIDVVFSELEKVRTGKAEVEKAIEELVRQLEKAESAGQEALPGGGNGGVVDAVAVNLGEIGGKGDEKVHTIEIPAEALKEQESRVRGFFPDSVVRSRVREALRRGYLLEDGAPGGVKPPRIVESWLPSAAQALRLACKKFEGKLPEAALDELGLVRVVGEGGSGGFMMKRRVEVVVPEVVA